MTDTPHKADLSFEVGTRLEEAPGRHGRTGVILSLIHI